MAKKTSGTMYLRKRITSNGGTFAQDSLDLSSFVDLPEGVCLRINQIWFQWSTDNFGTIEAADVAAAGPAGASIQGQITTASRTTRAGFTSNSAVALNNLYAHVDAVPSIDMINQDSGLNPVDFNKGFIVATDSLFFACQMGADTFADELNMSCLIECEMIKLNKDDAITLAVSQLAG